MFVLARNVVKLVVERRRGLPFSRFRAKLVRALLGLTIVPAVLVLLVGSELIRSSTEKWFSPPVDDVLTSANAIAEDYYQRARGAVDAASAARIGAGAAAAAELAPGDVDERPRVRSRRTSTQRRVALVEVYRVQPTARPAPRRRRWSAVESPALPRGHVARRPIVLASRVAGRRSRTQSLEPLVGGGELVRAAAPCPRRRGRAGRRRRRERPPDGRAGRRMRAASSRPTRTTASCASCSGRSRASTCRSS